jgi:hypothetical protein
MWVRTDFAALPSSLQSVVVATTVPFFHKRTNIDNNWCIAMLKL